MYVVNGQLLLTILNHGQGDHFVELARGCGASGATVFPAKGTATSSVLRVLGLGDTSKDVVMIVASKTVIEKTVKAAEKEEKLNGICAVLGSGDKKMSKNWKMITVIVNAGYAEDVMEAARKAGATGGTITHARGTAPKGHEEHFMGITIVPEKEMVFILGDEEKAEAIVKSIKSLECLKEPGMGIIYTQDVEKFANLGKK